MYANNFAEIPTALGTNVDLRKATLALVATDPIPGKVLEGGTRTETFREIMGRLISGQVNIGAAIAEVDRRLSRATSPHGSNNRVFPNGWAERLVRTQLSRFYNQAVLEECVSSKTEHVFVPHSPDEDNNSKCSQFLAGRTHSALDLHSRLVRAYRDGNWKEEVRLPDHPHCTHVAVPTRG